MAPLTRSVRDARPLGVHVYEQLRSMIVSQQFTEDEQLVQERIAGELGVSRTPVREALNRLSQEGLVSWVAGVGYMVNALTDHDIADVQQVRSALEPLAMSLALGNHTAGTLAEAMAATERMATIDADDVDAHFELNRRFHLTMVRPCGNALLVRMLDDLWNQPINRRITGAYVRIAGNAERMVDEHRLIVDAAAAGDRPRLLALVADHLRAGYTAAMHTVDVSA
jgi:DNA-binding GntR family transcriptional regulator